MNRLNLVLAGWVVVTCLTWLEPQPAAAEFRTWTTADGSAALEAEFVKLQGGSTVFLRLKSGEIRNVPLDRLSAADADYLRNGAKPGTGGPTDPTAPQPPSDPNYDHPPLPTKLVSHLRVCLQAKQITELFSQEQTTRFDFFRELAPDVGVLIGFDITYGPKSDGGPFSHTILSYTPIYLTPAGKVLGQPRGYKTLGAKNHLEAKPGYAVGKIQLCSGPFTVDGMIVTYMKLTPQGLDATDAYESRMYGRLLPTLVKPPVGGDGSPIIGVHGTGRSSGYVHSLGLTAAPRGR